MERKIIEEKYLSPIRVNDINVYLDLGLTKDQYYIKKGEAISQIATALGIILVPIFISLYQTLLPLLFQSVMLLS
ncbi:hypothetical protein [Brevibacillus laterosporus]|uniref:hypothetical protein n=1 Tax=Brevibacillus laterosporus TaxID=1465 RepID=UPI002852CBC1|nr:hypothetical protein [Brevibacillus laterosporus]